MGITRLEKDSTDGKVVIDTLIHDAVGRNKYLWQFACFCSAQEKRASIALDGGWGTGKSFFLRQLQVLFDAHSNKSKQLTEDQQNAIRLLFQNYKKNDGMGMPIHPHICVYYDAWLNDNAEDPMRSILHEIITETDTNRLFEKGGFWRRIYKRICAFFRKQSFSPSLMEALKTLCNAADAINPLNPPEIIFPYLKAGQAVLPLFECLKKNNPVREIDIQKRFHKAFEDYLDEAITDKNSRLLVLIDELDRCKPTYAVKLLERIKHYLSNEKITFVFAVNEQQLQSTIRAFYGDNFKACEYLDRFFDYRLSLPPPDIERFFNYYSLFHVDKESVVYLAVCEAVIKEYSFSLRETIKYIQWVKIVCKSFAIQGNDSERFGWQFIMHIIIPFIFGLKLRDTNLLDSFLAGKQRDYNPLRTIVEHCEIAQYFLFLPQRPFVFPKDAKFDRNKMVSALSNLDNLYSIIFINKLNGNDSQSMLSFTITKEMIDTIYEASNFMADFIKYDTNTEETAHG